ncbi:MAG: hypothetical protein HQM10_20845 [Candidatus Riflebacteria bacterium]|nr:hypothetical protein [Candidatus Riflebacteria bacterium]
MYQKKGVRLRNTFLTAVFLFSALFFSASMLSATELDDGVRLNNELAVHVAKSLDENNKIGTQELLNFVNDKGKMAEFARIMQSLSDSSKYPFLVNENGKDCISNETYSSYVMHKMYYMALSVAGKKDEAELAYNKLKSYVDNFISVILVDGTHNGQYCGTTIDLGDGDSDDIYRDRKGGPGNFHKDFLAISETAAAHFGTKAAAPAQPATPQPPAVPAPAPTPAPADPQPTPTPAPAPTPVDPKAQRDADHLADFMACPSPVENELYRVSREGDTLVITFKKDIPGHPANSVYQFNTMEYMYANPDVSNVGKDICNDLNLFAKLHLLKWGYNNDFLTEREGRPIDLADLQRREATKSGTSQTVEGGLTPQPPEPVAAVETQNVAPVSNDKIPPGFNWYHYLLANPDVYVAGGGESATQEKLIETANWHVSTFAANEGRAMAPFTGANYLEVNPDVKAAGIDPFEHYHRHVLMGNQEPRMGTAYRLQTVDFKKWEKHVNSLPACVENYNKLMQAWRTADVKGKLDLEPQIRDNNNDGKEGGWYFNAASAADLEEIYAFLAHKDPMLAKHIQFNMGIALPQAALDHMDSLLKIAVHNTTAQIARWLSYRSSATGASISVGNAVVVTGNMIQLPGLQIKVTNDDLQLGGVTFTDGVFVSNVPFGFDKIQVGSIGENDQIGFMKVFIKSWIDYMAVHPVINWRLGQLYPEFLKRIGEIANAGSRDQMKALWEGNNGLKAYILATKCHDKPEECELANTVILDLDVDAKAGTVAQEIKVTTPEDEETGVNQTTPGQSDGSNAGNPDSQ